MAQPHLHSVFRHSLIHPDLVSLVILTAVGHKSDHHGGGIVRCGSVLWKNFLIENASPEFTEDKPVPVTTDSEAQFYSQFYWSKDQY